MKKRLWIIALIGLVVVLLGFLTLEDDLSGRSVMPQLSPTITYAITCIDRPPAILSPAEASALTLTPPPLKP